MKTMNSSIKRVVVMVMVLAAAFALPAMAQPQDYNQAIQPNATFHSTSTMTGSGSAYSSKPMLNADGTAHYSGATPAQSYSPVQAPAAGPHKAPPIHADPLGDALLPLMLCALAYLIFRARKRAKGERANS